MSKILLREFWKKQREEILEDRKIKASSLMQEFILSISLKKERVFSFMSFGSEIDTAGLNKILLSVGKLCLPKEDEETLSYKKITSFDCLKKNRYGFLEPDETSKEKIAPTKNDILLVPALAFDVSGYRLGYGRGHFDKFFDRNPDGFKIGIGFVEQHSLESLKIDKHDKNLDAVFLF